jgi:hypothetical protein
MKTKTKPPQSRKPTAGRLNGLSFLNDRQIVRRNRPENQRTSNHEADVDVYAEFLLPRRLHESWKLEVETRAKHGIVVNHCPKLVTRSKGKTTTTTTWTFFSSNESLGDSFPRSESGND